MHHLVGPHDAGHIRVSVLSGHLLHLVRVAVHTTALTLLVAMVGASHREEVGSGGADGILEGVVLAGRDLWVLIHLLIVDLLLLEPVILRLVWLYRLGLLRVKLQLLAPRHLLILEVGLFYLCS